MSEHGVSDVETYMIDDHEMLKRASTECMCNLLLNEQVRVPIHTTYRVLLHASNSHCKSC